MQSVTWGGFQSDDGKCESRASTLGRLDTSLFAHHDHSPPFIGPGRASIHTIRCARQCRTRGQQILRFPVPSRSAPQPYFHVGGRLNHCPIIRRSLHLPPGPARSNDEGHAAAAIAFIAFAVSAKESRLPAAWREHAMK